MVGDEGGNAGEVGLEQLLRNFLDVQHRRAAVYSLLHRGFADYLKTSADVPYQELCGQVTTNFSECSRQVLEIEEALRDPKVNRPDLATVLQAVQLQEKQKLHMTATLQVLRRAGRPSERAAKQGHEHSKISHPHGPICSHGPEGDADGDTGLEMAQLEAEYDAAIKEATGVIQDAVMTINEHIEEVRYEIEELKQTREAVQAKGRLSYSAEFSFINN